MNILRRVPTPATLLSTAVACVVLWAPFMLAARPGEVITPLIALVPALLTGGAALVVVQQAATDERRRQHHALAVGLGLQAAGQVLDVVLGGALLGPVGGALPGLLVVVGTVGVGAAMTLDPGIQWWSRVRERVVADACFVAATLFTVSWAWQLRGWIDAPPPVGPSAPVQVAVTLAHALALGIGLTALSATRDPGRRRFHLAAGLGLLAAAGAHLLTSVAMVHDAYAFLRLGDVLRLVAPLLVLHLLASPADVTEDDGDARRRRVARGQLLVAFVSFGAFAVAWTAEIARRGQVPAVMAVGGLVALAFGALGYAMDRRVHADLVAGLTDEARTREHALRGQTARFEAMIRNASDYVTLIGERGGIRYQSPSVARILGHVPDVPAFDYLVHPEDRGLVVTLFHEARDRAPDAASARLRVIHADGTYRVLEVLASDLSKDPDVEGIVLNARDITERRDLERRLSWRATHDTLTTLANRDLLVARLRKAVAATGPTRPIVLFVDLDGFKTVNDTLGHSAGDDLLRLVAQRLRASTRGADLVARLGGDEFAVLLTDASERSARTVALRVIDALREPFDLGSDEVTIHGSVGVAVAEEGLSVDDLLVRADLAMYDAKGSGGNRLSNFDPVMNADAAERLDLMSRLREAIATRAIDVVYQPVVSTQGGHIRSAEALARWLDPELGQVSPGRFVPLAEETGLITRLGRLVLDDAIATLARWHALDPAGAGSIAVNVSARELSEPSFSAWISAALQTHGVHEQFLTLEITERLLVDSTGPVLENLTALRRAGVRVAVDDFGTGYSSLSMLDTLPADVLKIDRAFVLPLHPQTADTSLAAVIEQLARTLHLETVAEGVETEQQAEALRRIGCTYLQGYLFHRPGTAEELFAAADAHVGARRAA